MEEYEQTYGNSPVKFRWREKTIMIVEDVRTNHMLIDRILRRTSANLLWAMDGEKAVQMAKENDNIDLILMDIRLPKMNGYDATREIRKFRQDVPIIAQTAYVLPEEKGKVLSVGCNDLLTKPIRKNQLLATVSRYIDKEKYEEFINAIDDVNQ
jgi:two-component system, cell cycle response regulator DivK